MPRRFHFPPVEEHVEEFVIDESWYANHSCVGEVDREERDLICTSWQEPDGEPPKRDVDLLDFTKELVDGWNRQHQRRGTCVGQGFKVAVDIVMAVNSIVSGTRWEGRAAVAPIYAGSRVEIAGKPGRWDGSYGYAAAKWLRDFGVVLLAELDLPDDAMWEDEKLAVAWAAKRSGVPKDYEGEAQEKPITSYVNIKNTRQAAWLLDAGHPNVQCSSLIPSGTTDSRGMSRPRRSGGHCTGVFALRYHRGEREWAYDNSWGVGWGQRGRVWLRDRDYQAMLNRGDSYALIGQTGMETIAG